MINLILFIVFLIFFIPVCIKWNNAGIERYRRYDRLAFWNSLSDEEKDNADWYMEQS